MPSLFRTLAVLSAVLPALPTGTATALSSAGTCRLDVAGTMAAATRSYQSALNECIRFKTNGACDPGGFLIEDAVGKILRLFDPGAPCGTALAGGADPADALPAACATASSPGFCLVNLTENLHGKLRHDLDLPETVDSLGEQQCMRTATSALTKAVRAGMKSTESCAEDGGEPPWSCPLDLAPGSRLDKALVAVDRKIAKCRDGAGLVGSIGTSLSRICNRAVVSTDDLSSCIREIAVCQACLVGNLMFGQEEDCSALSGDEYCSLSSSKPAPNSFFVTNRGDDSVTFFNEESDYRNGTLEASTFAVGIAPVDAAVAERANAVFVVNRDSDSVTALRADNGQYLNGTLAASTLAVGDAPVAAIVHPLKDIVYVANSGADSVTFLDARDGSYVYGTLAASTFPVGQEPSALALNAEEDVLYVANAADDTISLLDATTGWPTFGLASLATFATGPEPRALRTFSYGILLVANAGDGTVWSLDEVTGLPWARAYGYSYDPLPTRDTAPGPVALAANEDDGSIYVGLGDAARLLSWDASAPAFEIATVGSPSDIEIGGTFETDFFEPQGPPLLVTMSDRDVVSLVPAPGREQPLGLSPLERSTVSTPDLTVIAADSTRDELLARRTSTGTLVVLGASDLGVHHEVDVQVSQILLDEPGGTIYALHEWSGVAVLDSDTGAGRYGTLEQSTITCGCTIITDFAIDPSRDRLYLACDDHVEYVDTTTGTCLGGSRSTTGVPDLPYMCGLGMDVASSRVLASPCGGYAVGPGIVLLDPLVPIYKNGTLEASTLVGGEAANWTLTPSPDGTRIFTTSGWGWSYIRVFDSASGAELKYFAMPSFLYGYAISFHFDVDNDLVLAVGNGLAVALRLSDLSFLGGTIQDATIKLLDNRYSPHYGVAGLMPAGPAEGAVVTGGFEALTFLDRPTLDYLVGEPLAAIREIPTRRDPSAIAVMPPLRTSWLYDF